MDYYEVFLREFVLYVFFTPPVDLIKSLQQFFIIPKSIIINQLKQTTSPFIQEIQYQFIILNNNLLQIWLQVLFNKNLFFLFFYIPNKQIM